MTNRRAFLASGLAMAFVLSASAALANDDGLYEDVFDAQSSFVRVLTSGRPFAAIGGRRLEGFTAGLSAYVNVMPGTVSLTHSGGTTDIPLAPGTHYTVLLGDEAAPVAMTDALQRNPAKADVSLYNISAASPVDLYVPAARAVALSGVPGIASSSVALKAPRTLDFDFCQGEEKLVTLAAVELKRKTSVSFVLSGAEGAFSAAAVPNTYVR